MDLEDGEAGFGHEQMALSVLASIHGEPLRYRSCDLLLMILEGDGGGTASCGTRPHAAPGR